MRLAEYTDYALRVLMYCASRPDRLVTIAELAEHHIVSKNHLMKIVNDLARQGILQTTRGRGGGLRLLKQPGDICIGDVVRLSETDFRMVECFDPLTNTCTLTPSCRLKGVFDSALKAYFRELDGVTLADITTPTLPSAHRVPSSAAPTSGPLASLLRRQGSVDSAAPPPELQAVQRFAGTWAQLRVDQQLRRALTRQPDNAGPLNSQRLVLQTLQQLRGLSPAYLQRFMAHAEALLWLQDSAPTAAAAPGKRSDTERPRRPTRRGKP